jgi:hypothetical protein
MNANYLLKVLTLVLGACLPLLLSQLSYSQESLQASFKSWNYRDYYIRHKNFAVFLERIVDQQGRNDASFIFVPGLAGYCWSIQAIHPLNGYYLRHRNFKIELSKPTRERSFAEDATFCLRRGLADTSRYNFSFETGSRNLRGYYMRHSDFGLFLNRNDGSNLFKGDATFVLEPSFKFRAAGDGHHASGRAASPEQVRPSHLPPGRSPARQNAARFRTGPQP